MSERILTPDLCVIGAGSGGLSVASGAVQMGASVVLIEAGEMGGDCLNTGCVPSKALLAAGKAAHHAAAGARFGVTAGPVAVDFAAAKDHVAAAIAAIAPHDSVERFEGLGVTVLKAFARFEGPDEVSADGTRIRARRFVIATGAKPAIPPIPGLAETPHLTSETIFGLREAPSRLLILGGGAIGLEMAQAHRRLGCEVTVIEADRALGREDPELAAIALDALRAEGIEIVEGARAASVGAGPAPSGGVRLAVEDGRSWTGSHLLVATGRAPDVSGLNLEAAGIAADRAGVKVDAGLRTTNRRVYAIGDAAAGLPAFTHSAGWQAGLVIRSALFRLPVTAETRAMPMAVYTDPELARVGPTEAEARATHGDRLEVIRVPFAGSDRAVAEGATAGLLKLLVVKGRPVGAGIVGAQAGELIGLWTLAIGAKMKLGAVAGMIAPYPTLGELSKRAAGQHFSPRLFESPMVRRVVRLLARLG
ncbi:Pyruvate/2-oxoglutarate dehydrogenase complex, dihydrolipoamide dehydrogenase (E3) component [Albimonas donghaensis]|uniref:Pyruvate/2-oxoglutarate dehydrogenase complex, dihydrolipoamide dehydrogenase (E3) component n=1 Tax=Albimonas donghaensis TaxID=356660 RepID=A0A1H3A1M5_9RHOB|nr:FAD-dependent oxidoreductase [Albimonas donghaensis]SDX23526.1 Pyruvate/2-oxoglutarate dehydrogenase complex, dihydrolipoamide dehydrogenase (E3) component [Albimonas donghaensis]